MINQYNALIFAVCFTIILITVMAIFKKEEPKSNVTQKTTSIKKQESVSLEKQLETFQNLGLHLSKGITIEDLLEMQDRSEYEKNPYEDLFWMLGRTTEKEPWTPLSSFSFAFDTEIIEDPGEYKNALENLMRISNNQLEFTNISDELDYEKEYASVTFDYKGKTYNWELEYDNDWFDMNLFERIVELTKEQKTEGKLAFYNTGDQTVHLLWVTEEQKEKLEELANISLDFY